MFKPILGVSRLLSPAGNSPAWERTDASDILDLVANANKCSSVEDFNTKGIAEDDFAMAIHGGTLPFYKDIDIVNMRVSDGAIVARLSDSNSNFTWGNDIGRGAGNNSSGEAVDVMTYYPGHYIKRWQDTAQEAGSEANRREHIQLSMWNFDGAMYVEPYYRGTFEAISDSNTISGKTILRSYAGVQPTVSTTIANFRTYAGNNGMSLGDWRDFDFLCLYLIKYANYNSQGQVGNGVVSGSKVVTDNNNARNTLEGRDGFIGIGNTSVWCLGLCNPWGNVWEFVDGITIRDSKAIVSTDPAKYVNSAMSSTPEYTNIGYTNWASEDEGYPGKLGYDSNNPLIAFPTDSGGSASTGICDYYFQDSGVCLVLRGGAYIYAYNSGAFSLACTYVFTHTGNYVGCRLLKEA